MDCRGLQRITGVYTGVQGLAPPATEQLQGFRLWVYTSLQRLRGLHSLLGDLYRFTSVAWALLNCNTIRQNLNATVWCWQDFANAAAIFCFEASFEALSCVKLQP